MSLNIQILVYFLRKKIAILLKKVTSLFASNSSLRKFRFYQPPPFFENLVRGSKRRKKGADFVVIPSPLFSYFLLHKSRYAHVLESLFNNIPGLTVAVLLNTIFFSSYLTNLHKFKNLKRTVFKDL